MRHTISTYLDGRMAREFCTVCGCEQGEMPTDCPGYPIRNADKRAVALGEKDFINGEWIAIDSSAKAG